jgi:hypothetical protein
MAANSNAIILFQKQTVTAATQLTLSTSVPDPI